MLVAGKQDRQRKLARERWERQQERRVERQRKIRQRGAIGGSVAAVIAIAVGAYFLFGTSSKPSAAANPKPTSSSSSSSSPNPAGVSIPAATPLATVPTGAPKTKPASHCTSTPSGTAARKVSAPPSTPDSSA